MQDIDEIAAAASPIIKRFEGCELKAYKCPAGVWTIGYGHTAMAGAPRPEKDMIIGVDVANELLLSDLSSIYIPPVLTFVHDLTINQYAALVSFAYNLGVGNLQCSSLMSVIRENAGNLDDIEYQFGRWVFAKGKKLRGLVRRRAAEFELYASGTFGFGSQPTAPAKFEYERPVAKAKPKKRKIIGAR